MSPEVAQLLDASAKRIEAPRPTNCVIAALESAFHATATKEERTLRDKLSDEKEAKLAPLRENATTPQQALLLYQANLILETRAITSFFTQVRSSTTPLGRTLRLYDVSQTVIKGQELEGVITPNCISLIALTTFQDEWHMMHVKQMDSGKIVSGNDGNQEIVLQEDKPYLVYQFRKKAPTK